MAHISEEDITDQRLLELKKAIWLNTFSFKTLSHQSRIIATLISLDLPFERYNETANTLDKISKKDIIITLKSYLNEDNPKAILTVKPL